MCVRDSEKHSVSGEILRELSSLRKLRQINNERLQSCGERNGLICFFVAKSSHFLLTKTKVL